MSDEAQLCTFLLAGHLFGVDVNHVHEVLLHQPMTPVPLAHPVVRGLINLRGKVVTALDLRRRLELPERPDGLPPMNVVVGTTDGPVSLLVDEIGDILTAPAGAFERAPGTLGGPAGELLHGVYKLDGRLLLVLDTTRAVTLPTHGPNEEPH
ncbi:chemotaxis protein CheW [Gemmata sp. JC717]|uniref:chemotaxis protein CheW n=1 Tax=Gemmata algarum TaxID=2975278 RepID=UPI0021BB8C81|nr:chemotaxis protein CheW [Gemmata algarum]MDY3554193.1 chemotaxis protein CheW [Gemmata algarum]